MEDAIAFDPKRRLCPDGTCTGIIGPDGRCSECGRLATSMPATDARGANDVDIFGALDAAEGETDDRTADELSSSAGTAESTVGSGGFDPNRRLCPDGACVGVLGPGGACTVCGRTAA